MSKTRFSGLGTVMRAQAEMPPLAAASEGEPMPDEMPGEDDTEDEEDCEASDGPKKKDSTMSTTEDQNPQAGAEAISAAVTAERQRIAAVFASDDVKGREQAAAELLANSDMNASAIVAMLPKLTPAAQVDEGANMLDAMRQNASTDLGLGSSESDQSAADHGWGKAHAKAAKHLGRISK